MTTSNCFRRLFTARSFLAAAVAASLSLIGLRDACAQSALTYNDGDLFLGFRATDGTSDYLVNLGQASQFVGQSSGSSQQASVGNIGADLTTVFGSDWYTRIDANTGTSAVKWAIVGAREVAASSDPANTLYSTSANSSAWPRLSDTAQSYTSSLIASLGNAFSGNQSTANSPQGLIQTAAANNSYASFQPGGSHSQGISFQTWNPSNEGAPSTRLFLDRITPGSGASELLGVLTLSSNGNVTFTAGNNPIGQLLNLSTRLDVLTGDNVLIGGFIVTGSDPKQVLIRGLGPSLAQKGVQNALQDPTLELDASGVSAPVYMNDDWQQQDDPAQVALIAATTIPPDDPRESAMVQTLQPGNYTAIVRGKGDATGVGQVEIYDIAQSANSQLGNISTRGFVEVGENIMIGGLIVGPDKTLPARVLVRAIGPSLANANPPVPNALPDPFLNLKDVNGTSVASNDNWQDTQAAEITATGIPPSDPKESAIVATLPPGNYTAQVSGAGDSTGNALVEIYNLQ